MIIFIVRENVDKSTKASCKLKGRQTRAVLKLVHSDLCGLMPVRSIGGPKYFDSIDSRKTVVYCLRGKDEVTSYVRKYNIARVERVDRIDKKIKRIRITD